MLAGNRREKKTHFTGWFSQTISGRFYSIDFLDVLNFSTIPLHQSLHCPNFLYFSNLSSGTLISKYENFGKHIFSFKKKTVILSFFGLFFLACFWKKPEIYNCILLVLFSITEIINYWEAIWSVKNEMHSPTYPVCYLHWLQLLWTAIGEKQRDPLHMMVLVLCWGTRKNNDMMDNLSLMILRATESALFLTPEWSFVLNVSMYRLITFVFTFLSFLIRDKLNK